jgi:hypothetical protein
MVLNYQGVFHPKYVAISASICFSESSLCNLKLIVGNSFL